MKRKMSLLFICIVLMLLTACGEEGKEERIKEAERIQEENYIPPVEKVEPEIDLSIYGNTYGNMYGKGMFLKYDGGIIYYDGYTKLAVKRDDDGETLIMGAGLNCMNIVGDYLYGIGISDPYTGMIVKEALEGGPCEVLRESPTTELMSIEDTLYYVDADTRYFYSYNLETNEEKCICEEVVYYPVVIDNRLFYQNDELGECLYAMDLETGEETALDENHVYNIQPYGSRIFYMSKVGENDPMSLYSVKYDGSEWEMYPLQKLMAGQGEYTFGNFNIAGDNLYFTATNTESIYLMSIDLTRDELREKKIDLYKGLTFAYEAFYGNAPDEYTRYSCLSIWDNTVYICLEVTIDNQLYSVPIFIDLEKEEFTVADSYIAPLISEVLSQIVNENADEIEKVLQQQEAAARPAVSTDEMAKTAFDYANDYRAAIGLSALVWDDSIASVCNIRCQELAVSFSHTRPNGTGPDVALTENGVAYSVMGENIAYGQTSARQVADGWYSSEDHRHNMLDTDYTRTAVGCANIGGIYYWVQLFAN